jgi:hypothetical protein
MCFVQLSKYVFISSSVSALMGMWSDLVMALCFECFIVVLDSVR